jgi:hypothetical protein
MKLKPSPRSVHLASFELKSRHVVERQPGIRTEVACGRIAPHENQGIED